MPVRFPSLIQKSATESPPTVLVFDSGVGGLSIFLEIRSLLPAIDLIYACDNQAFPYGTKEAAHLIDRVVTVQKRLLEIYPIDLLVLACNSASTVALPALRQQLTVPVVGVVPAIKTAASISKTRVIGLLATDATVERRYIQELIDNFAADCTVIRVGSQCLVDQAERKLRNQTLDWQCLQSVVDKLNSHPAAAQLDTVVLGCTHFPLLREELAELIPKPVQWVDSGNAIARRVKQLLLESGAYSPADADRSPRLSAVFTQSCPRHQAIFPYLKSIGIDDIELITC